MKKRDFEAARTALADEYAARLTLCSLEPIGFHGCALRQAGAHGVRVAAQAVAGRGGDADATGVFGFEVSSYVVS